MLLTFLEVALSDWSLQHVVNFYYFRRANHTLKRRDVYLMGMILNE